MSWNFSKGNDSTKNEFEGCRKNSKSQSCKDKTTILDIRCKCNTVDLVNRSQSLRDSRKKGIQLRQISKLQFRHHQENVKGQSRPRNNKVAARDRSVKNKISSVLLHVPSEISLVMNQNIYSSFSFVFVIALNQVSQLTVECKMTTLA